MSNGRTTMKLIYCSMQSGEEGGDPMSAKRRRGPTTAIALWKSSGETLPSV